MQVRPAIRKVIYPDGTERELEGPVSIQTIQKLIGTPDLDSLTLADGIHIMFVDDLGIPKGLPANPKATELYRERSIVWSKHKIVGTVVVAPDSDFGPVFYP